MKRLGRKLCGNTPPDGQWNVFSEAGSQACKTMGFPSFGFLLTLIASTIPHWQILVVFHSDLEVSGRGFQIEWKAMENPKAWRMPATRDGETTKNHP